MIFAAALAMISAGACNATNAVHLQPYQLMANPEQRIGQCVSLDGYVNYYRFFADIAGVYRYSSRFGPYSDNDGWLGMYASDASEWPSTTRTASVMGVVDTCEHTHAEAQAQAEPGSLIMMIGYCHYDGGLILTDVVLDLGHEVTFERQTGEANRRAFGDLSEQQPSSMMPVEVKALFDEYATALGAGNSEAIGGLIEPWIEDAEDIDARLWTEYFAGNGESPLSRIRGEPHSAEKAYFYRRERAASEDTQTDRDWFECYCVEDDCSGLWPISAIDATAAPDRPYVCFRAFHREYYRNGARMSGWELATDWMSGEFPEPD